MSPIFARQNVPNSTTVKKIFDKLESTDSISDVKNKTRARRSISQQNITAVRESQA